MSAPVPHLKGIPVPQKPSSQSIARFSSACLALTLTIVLTGCSSNESTAGDGEITVYSGRSEELVEPLIEKFERESGTKVNVRYGETAAMASQLLEEGDKTKADVFLAQDAGALGAVAKEGLFSRLPDELLRQVPRQYRGSSGTWVGVTGRARVIAFNPETVPESKLPDDIFEITEPQWKGRVGIAPTNASFQSFVTAMRLTEGDERTEKFLTDLRANDVQIRERNGVILDDVDAGRLDLGLINHYYWYEKQAEIGEDKVNAKLHFLRNGDPGALVNVSGVGVLEQSGSDSDARDFVSYLLSEEGQRYFAEQTYEYPLTDDVSPADGLPRIDELSPPDIDLDDLDSLQQTIAMIRDSGLTN